jgi:hypothetical protein
LEESGEMRAFEVRLNESPLYTAGIGVEGVMTAVISHVTKRVNAAGRVRNDLALEVGGLISLTREHVRWRSVRLKVGDEVSVRIIDANSVDRPLKRHRDNPATERGLKKNYVRNMAKEWGWTITRKRPRPK